MNSYLLQGDDLKLTGKTSRYEKNILGLPWWLSGKEFAPPMQETWVQPLIWEDPKCCKATK